MNKNFQLTEETPRCFELKQRIVKNPLDINNGLYIWELAIELEKELIELKKKFKQVP